MLCIRDSQEIESLAVMTSGEPTIPSCAIHPQVSACMGPHSVLHMDMSFDAVLGVNRFMLCSLESNQDKSNVIMRLQQVRAHSIAQSSMQSGSCTQPMSRAQQCLLSATGCARMLCLLHFCFEAEVRRLP